MSLNHQSIVPLIVDTGATEHILTDWFAKKSGLKLRQTNESDTDSGGLPFDVSRAEVNAFEVEKEARTDLKVAVVSSSAFPENGGVAGLFSPQTFFKLEAYLIDFPNALLKTGADAVVREGKILETLPLYPCSKVGNVFMIEAKINDVVGRFNLDSGGFKSALRESFAAKVGNLKTEDHDRNGLGGRRKVKRATGLRLSVGKLKDTIAVDIEKDSAGCPGNDGKFGIEWMSRFTFSFNRDRTQVALIRK